MKISDDELAGQILETMDLCSEILDGSVKNSKWNGYGASLCVVGLNLIQECIRRDWPRGNGWDTEAFPFFVQAQFMMAMLGERIEKPKDLEGKPRMHMEGKERIPKSSSSLICRSLSCGRRPGFTNIGSIGNPWWVCGNCHRPTEGWFQGQGDDVLNMFREGPLSGMVYDSKTLLGDIRLASIVLGYSWTDEILTSPHTGRKARVWFYVAQTPDSVTQSAQPVQPSSPLEGVRMSTPEAPAVPEPTDAPAPAPAAVVEPVDVSDLLSKRNSLKLSRTVVANKAGVTVAQLYRIEQGGKRTTEDEAAKVRQALVELEAEQPVAAPAEAAANPA